MNNTYPRIVLKDATNHTQHPAIRINNQIEQALRVLNQIKLVDVKDLDATTYRELLLMVQNLTSIRKNLCAKFGL